MAFLKFKALIRRQSSSGKRPKKSRHSEKTLSMTAAASEDGSIDDGGGETGAHGCSSSPRDRRRAGRIWSRGSSNAKDLVPVARATSTPLRSCMKVSTLEDSLRLCASKSKRRPKTKGAAATMLRGSHIPDRMRWPPSSSATSHRQTKLRFGALHVREYTVIAVDHPGVSKGPAVGLDWSYVESTCAPRTVDEYESTRPPRRKLKEIKLTDAERRMKLLKSGVTLREVEEMMTSITEAKERRRKTLDGIEYSGTDELLEGAIKKVRIALHLRKRHSEAEEDLWDEAQKNRTAFHSVAA